MGNLPKVIDTLWEQTMKPKNIVLTIARKDWEVMQPVVDSLPCDVLIVENDTKVFKKFLPAMDAYCDKGDLVLCVDDDKLYPADFAESMLYDYEGYNRVFIGRVMVSGNRYWHNGLKCHCGSASLVVPEAFVGWRNYEKHFNDIESDDMFYTMLAAKNGYIYRPACLEWEKQLQKYNPVHPYTRGGMVQRTYERVLRLFKWI